MCIPHRGSLGAGNSFDLGINEVDEGHKFAPRPWTRGDRAKRVGVAVQAIYTPSTYLAILFT